VQIQQIYLQAEEEQEVKIWSMPCLWRGGGGSVLTASKIDSENSDGDGVDNSNDDEHAKVRSDRD